MCVSGSVVGRHRFDADLDLDPTFYFDADPDSDPDPTPRFTHVETAECLFTFVAPGILL